MRIKVGKLAVICVIVLVICACNLTNTISAPSEGSAAEEVKTIKQETATLSSAGGSFVIGDATFSVDSSNIQNDVEVTLRETSNPYPENDAIAGRSNIYFLQGLPMDFQGVIAVSLKIPKNLMKLMDKNDPSSADKLTLLMGSMGLARSSGGETLVFNPMDAQVDLLTGTVTATVDFNSIYAYNPGTRLAKKMQQSSEDGELKQVAAFSMEVAYDQPKSNESDHFIVHNAGGYDSQQVAGLLSNFETARAKLAELGFEFGPYNETRKFPITILDCDEKEWGFFIGTLVVSDCDAKFNVSGYFRTLESSVSIQVNPRTLSGDSKNQLATVGHELMHFAQAVTYWDNYANYFKSFSTIDEAVAVWFESYVTGDAAWLPNIADTNSDFILRPWFTNDNPTAGYGASWFIHYLLSNNNTSLIHSIYESGYQNSQEAFRGISGDMGIQSQFKQFLPVYYFNPGMISAGLASDPNGKLATMRNHSILLQKNADDPTLLDFDTETQKEDFSIGYSTSGVWIVDKFEIEPEVTISDTLNPLNGEVLNIVAGDFAKEYCKPGNLEIAVASIHENTGLLVYALPTKFDFAGSTAIAGPDNILVMEGSGKVTVKEFGPLSCGATYPQVAIIYVYFGDPSEADMASIDATITFTPLAGTINAMFDESSINMLLPADSPKLCGRSTTCNETYNPCPAVETGGGGGGGEGDTTLPDCAPLPKYCYSCDPNYCAAAISSQTLDANYLAETRFAFTVDGEGHVTNIELNGLWAHNPALVELKSVTPFSFEATFSLVYANCEGASPGYLTLYGQLDTSWTGAYIIGHEAIGDTISGTWSEEVMPMY